MTAELGILNKIGIALAADSAVTISGNGNKKIYNTVNKLFALSNHHPVGIMIYGSDSYMNIPWEIIIKEYKRTLGAKVFNTLKEYVDDFYKFIQNESQFYNTKYEKKKILTTYRNKLIRIKKVKVSKLIRNLTLNEKNSLTINDIESFWITTLREEITSLAEDAITLNIKDLNQIIEDEYRENLIKIAESIFEDTIHNEELKGLLQLYLLEIIQRELEFSHSGVVIAGYGEKEYFPRLYERKVEGSFFGQLKYSKGRNYEIDAYDCDAAIAPFAQHEMILSFIYGIEPSLDDAYLKLFDSAFKKYVEEKGISNVNSEVNKVTTKLKEEIRQYKIEQSVEPLLQVVSSLPKEELASMAETLVGLTSFKRKVSMDAETVGGPIDVAFISKGDGFVWINRKHYFKPEFNHDFFQRKLGGKEYEMGDL